MSEFTEDTILALLRKQGFTFTCRKGISYYHLDDQSLGEQLNGFLKILLPELPANKNSSISVQINRVPLNRVLLSDDDNDEDDYDPLIWKMDVKPDSPVLEPYANQWFVDILLVTKCLNREQ